MLFVFVVCALAFSCVFPKKRFLFVPLLRLTFGLHTYSLRSTNQYTYCSPDCCFNECVCERVFVCCVLQKAESERVFFYIYIDSLILPIPTFAFYMYRITSFNHCTPKIYTHNTNAFASLAVAARIQMCVRAERECERRGNEAEEVNEKRRTHAHTHAHMRAYQNIRRVKRVSE